MYSIPPSTTSADQPFLNYLGLSSCIICTPEDKF